MYLLLVEDQIFFKLLRQKIGDQSKILLKFRRTDELILSCAIFSKIINHYPISDDMSDDYNINEPPKEITKVEDVIIDRDSQRLINALNIDTQHLIKMYLQIRPIIDDPIRIHAIWKLIQRNIYNSQAQNALNNGNDKLLFDYNLAVDKLASHDISQFQKYLT